MPSPAGRRARQAGGLRSLHGGWPAVLRLNACRSWAAVPRCGAVELFAYLLIAVAAYLLGSVPTGFLVGRARGVDIRTVGSGNIGATNVLRTLGKPVGIAVLLTDLLKGFAAVALTVNLFPDLQSAWPALFGGAPDGALRERLSLVAAVSVVLGHNYTCWLGFKGGKGIATSGGAFLALAPAATGIAVGVWAVVFLASRYVSLASIVAALALPAATWVLPHHGGVRVLATLLGALAIWKHRANLQRLRAGTEHRFGRKPATEGAAK